jgi:signal transduction histidine kinase
MAGPTRRLLDQTRRRLQAITLGLLFLLVAGIGAATALIGLAQLDADVDRAVEVTATTAITHLDGELPAAQESGDEQAPAPADTILLYLDAGGALVALPSHVGLAGLPDTAAVAAARATGRDLRTVVAGGVRVRLLTLPIKGSGDGQGGVIGYLQAGFVLTLHDEQSATLLWSILVAAAIGLAAASVITLLVTGRALAPIRRSIEAQQRFVADASHELRTPTAIIRSTADVLDREGLVSPSGRPLIGDIISESDRMGRLVGDLSTIASREDEPLVIQRSALDLSDLAKDAVRRIRPLAAKRELQVALASPDQAPMRGDADRLMQLLLILLDNALDHAPAGTVVAVEVRHPDASTLTVSVADQGSGVPPESRELIFQPFARLSRGGRRRAGGSGLGLAIARRIVTAHGGEIGVGSGPAGGAVFTVRLPAGARV